MNRQDAKCAKEGRHQKMRRFAANLRLVFLGSIILYLTSLSGCTNHRTSSLVNKYHAAEPPNDLFLFINESRFLGEANNHPLLYYSFVWSGGTSERGTHKLLAFNSNDDYVGYYYLGAALRTEACEINEDLVVLTFHDGEQAVLDFTVALPESSQNPGILFHPFGK